jgi:hypothetical protein
MRRIMSSVVAADDTITIIGRCRGLHPDLTACCADVVIASRLLLPEGECAVRSSFPRSDGARLDPAGVMDARVSEPEVAASSVVTEAGFASLQQQVAQLSTAVDGTAAVVGSIRRSVVFLESARGDKTLSVSSVGK